MEQIKFIRFGGLSAQKQIHRKDKIKSAGDGEVWLHTPPRKNGIFAFPYGYVDMFLLGATYHPSNSSGKSAWLKDDKGNLIPMNNDLEYDYNSKTDKLIFPKEIKRILKKHNIKEKNIWHCYLDPNRKNKDIECDDDVECEQCSKFNECKAPEYLVYLKKPRIFEYKGNIWHHLIDTTNPNHVIQKWNGWVETTYENYLLAFEKDRHKTLQDVHKSMKQNNNLNLLNDLKGRNNPYKKSPYYTYSKDYLEVFIEKI